MASRAITADTRTRRLIGLGEASSPWADGALMLAAAFLIRLWWFGDPVIQVDEQFYLLVGDRMLHGALPFVDIWDRKPIGLFVVYAAIRALGGGGIIEYQVVATLLAATTALLVVRAARLFATPLAARAAGVAALLWLAIFDGAGGQAPIIYGPLVAAGGLVTLQAAVDRRGGAVALWRAGAIAMLCVGLAIQIKYTAMFEGIGFGLALLWEGRRREIAADRLLPMAAGWIGLALAPTVLVLLVYAELGHAASFVYANFQSIGDRAPSTALRLAQRLGTVAAYGLPLAGAAVWGLAVPATRSQPERARRFMILWLVSAVIGFLAIGTFYKHYFLPVVTPLAIAAAPALDRLETMRRDGRRWGVAALIGMGALGTFLTGVHRWHARGDDNQVNALVAAIKPQLSDSLYVFDGEPILYYLTGARLPSPYAFPNHLNEHKEAAAIGVDPRRELRRIIADRPSVIVTSDRPAKDPNWQTWTMMRAALKLHYRAVATVRVAHRLRIVYARIGPAPFPAI